MKRFVFAALLATSALIAAGKSRSGKILAQAGVGPALPIHSASMESAMTAGGEGTRRWCGYDLALGIGIGEKFYAIARIDDSKDIDLPPDADLAIESFAITAGLRYYPKITGPYLGAGAGVGGMRISYVSSDDVSDPGFAICAGGGYDLSRNPRKLSLALEANFLSMWVDGENDSAVVLTLNLCYK